MLQAPDSEWDFARALGERRGDLYFRYRLRPSPHYVYFSPRIREVVGIPAEEACADPQLGDRLVHFDDRPLLKELRKGGYRSEAPVVLRWLHVDGSVVWTEQSFLPVRDHDGTLLGVDALVRCIEPPTAVRAMSGSEAERLRLLLNEQQDFSVIMLEPDGTIATWNAAAERMSGFAAHEVMGRHLDVLHTPEDVLAGRPRKILEHARRTGRYSAQEWRPRKDGTRYWCDLVVTALHDEQGRLVGFGRLARDLTERLALEEQLRQAQKMESVGRLAAGVAHDFNNLLSVILTAAVIGRRECPEQSPARADFEEIENAARRAATLTRQLLIFSRRQVTDPVVLRLDELVAGMQGMITRLVGEDVEVRVRSSCASPLVRGDRGQLEQVVLNLVVNARDAMPEGGVLTLETRELRLDAGFAEAAGVAQPGDYVVLTVSDTGCGMPEPVKARLFEPFFTTKEQGRGTGLGLPTCMGIVKQCGGAISVYSEEGRGSSFRVYLPRVTEEGVTPEPLQSAPRGGTESILLVEDEPRLRLLAARTLETAGYHVRQAANGGQAVELLEQDRCDLLITDVIMPGMSGVELAQRARAIDPGLCVLFVSGYTDEIIDRMQLPGGPRVLLPKPYSPDELLGRIRQLLDPQR